MKLKQWIAVVLAALCVCAMPVLAGAMDVRGANSIFSNIVISGAGASSDLITLKAPAATDVVLRNNGGSLFLASPASFWITSDTGMYFDTGGSKRIYYNSGNSQLQANTTIGSEVASGSNAFGIITNGARIDFGAGASDYASSDGTTVTFAGPVTATGTTGLSLATANARLTWSSSGRYISSNETTGDLSLTSFGLALGGNRVIGATAPTISSGFGTSPTIVASNGTAAFQINVGTGGVATSGVIGLPTATTGWVCKCDDITTENTTVTYTKQTASTTTSCTVANFTDIAGSGAWVASDKLNCIAMGY